MTDSRPITILCLASEFKAVPFLEEAKKLGCAIILVVAQEAAGAAWPRDSIDHIFPMPILWKQPDITYGVSYLARQHKIDRIVALDDYDVETAADLREHLRLPGMGHTVARYFRDKLAMRSRAEQVGLAVPPFSAIFNYDDLRYYMDNVPPPWVLKPRFEAGAIGIKKIDNPDLVWRSLDELGDKQSFYLLEKFVPGNVYHVDSVVWDNEVVFTQASRYGIPPLAVSHGGGVFSSRTLPLDSAESQTVTSMNARLMAGFDIQRGVSHTEFIRAEDGQFYFLETAARVGGANLDRLVYAGTAVSLWQEAARVVVADIRGERYEAPHNRENHAAILTCLSRQQRPNLSGYDEPEVVWRLNKDYHAGLIVSSPESERVTELVTVYVERFARDFVAVGSVKGVTRQ